MLIFTYVHTLMRPWLIGPLLLSFALSASARAEDESAEKAQARLLLSQGNAYFERGDLRAALVNFRAAYTAYPSPKLLVNAAAAERELGDIAGAATDLRHFLDDASDDDQALVERARADLRVLERRVARVSLGGWPPRSTLEIDGRAARDPTYVKPGAHNIKALSPTGGELVREIEPGPGDQVELPPPLGLRAQPLAPPLLDSAPVAHKSSKRGLAIGLGVAGGVILAVALGVGLYFVAEQPAQPLKGPLGTYHFSDFR
jgi:hypothetical protein